MHLTADIHTRTRARLFFCMGLCSAPHLLDGTGLACVFNFVPRLGTCVWRDGAAYKHSLYLVLYKYIYKMRVNPLG